MYTRTNLLQFALQPMCPWVQASVGMKNMHGKINLRSEGKLIVDHTIINAFTGNTSD